MVAGKEVFERFLFQGGSGMNRTKKYIQQSYMAGFEADKTARFLDKLQHYTGIPEYYPSGTIRKRSLKKTISRILGGSKAGRF